MSHFNHEHFLSEKTERALPQRLWQISAEDNHAFRQHSTQQWKQANHDLIGSGTLGELTIDFGGSAEQTGDVIDYGSHKMGAHAYHTGLDWEQSSQNAIDKLKNFVDALGCNAINADYKQSVDRQIDKIIGIGEGLNSAKEATKAGAFGALKALSDGDLFDLLAKPNAVNQPLFQNINNAFDAMRRDSNATNNLLGALCTTVVGQSEQYSKLSERQKGHVIGEAMFGLVNPEGSTEAVQVGSQIADELTQHAKQSIVQTVRQSISAVDEIGSTSPDVARQSKLMLADYVRAKGVRGHESEFAEFPKEYFDEEMHFKSGKGGSWPVLNERISPDVVCQSHDLSCVSAVGEMLSKGTLSEAEFMDKLGVPGQVRELPEVLGAPWVGGGVDPANLDVLLKRGPWAAELREPPPPGYHRIGLAHAVLVDGVDADGNIMIRDPAHGTRYEMTRKDFLYYWSCFSCYRD